MGRGSCKVNGRSWTRWDVDLEQVGVGRGKLEERFKVSSSILKVR